MLIKEHSRAEFVEANLERRTMQEIIIRAGKSLNNRLYSARVLKAAAPKFEGVKTFADHLSQWQEKNQPERSVTELTGWISDVHYDESRKALVGTRHFARTRAGNDVYEMAQAIATGDAPADLFGTSIYAAGMGESREDGVYEVQEITDAISVDDVTWPGAGGGFEKLFAASDQNIAGRLLENLSYDDWRGAAKPEFLEKIGAELAGPAFEAAAATRDRLQEIQEKLGVLEKEAAIQAHLSDAPMPAEWKELVGKRLRETPVEEWGEIIADEGVKLRAASRVSVPAPTAPDRITQTETRGNLLPRQDENLRSWLGRIKS